METKVTTSKQRERSATNEVSIGPYLSFFLILILTYAALSLAQPTGPDSVDPVSSERANISNSAGTVQAQAGNVSELNIQATAITKAWQGYYGNITGAITLEDSSGSVFYNWSSLGSISGEVYASRDSGVSWDSIGCASGGNISNENSFLGKQPSDPDSVNQTFSQNNHPQFSVGTTPIANDTCPSTNAFSGGAQDTSRFYQVLLADGQSDIVYTTLIDQDQLGFNGVNYDFQLLVGENGNASQADTTTQYFFYIELT